VYSCDRMPGIVRQRRGRSFRYFTSRRRLISEAKVLRRISALAVPPAYRDVWICSTARGHLQATGRDARGRKQYRYHRAWRELRDCAKFERVASFVAALPSLQRRLQHDLSTPGLPREKVLACVITLLMASAVRVGNLEYARENGSFGITTLRTRHVSFGRGGRAVLHFPGKGGVRHEIVVDQRRAVQIVQRCHALPGQHLFQYLDEDGNNHAISSGMVNTYLSEAMGGAFSAKDFRTWHATVHTLELLRAVPVPHDSTVRARRAVCTEVLRRVAQLLRNTPAVCRSSYVNPQLFTAWEDGSVSDFFRDVPNLRSRAGRRALLRFLRSC
jgi:DNA topoisomerase I